MTGPSALYLIATRQPPAEQGFYFVFANVQAIIALFEFGVGTMTVQLVAHEGVNVTQGDRGLLVGPAERVSSFVETVAALQGWYAIAALVLALLLFPIGLWFFHDESTRTGIKFAWPWAVAVASMCGYLALVPFLCTLEGLGRLRAVQQMRLRQAITGIAACAIIYWCGGLVGLASAAAMQLAIAVQWLASHQPLLVRHVVRAAFTMRDRPSHVSLRRAQTRTGINWIVALIGAQALVPIVFARIDSDFAGRVGLTLALTTAPLTLSLSWLQSRYPEYGRLAATSRFAALKEAAKEATVRALVVCVLGEGAVFTACKIAQMYLPKFAERLLPAGPFVALAVANVAFLLYQAGAAYLRAYRDEAFLSATTIGTLAVVTLSLLGASNSAFAAVYGFAVAVCFVWVPASAFIFLTRSRAIELAERIN